MDNSTTTNPETWQTVKPKSRSRKTNQGPAPASQNTGKDTLGQSSNTGCFDDADRKDQLHSTQKELMDKIYQISISETEFMESLANVCRKYSLEDKDWYAICEAENIIYDQKRISIGLEPIMSETYGRTIITNYLTFTSITQPEPQNGFVASNILPSPIALVCGWQVQDDDSDEPDTSPKADDGWKTNVICIMKTVEEFWQCLRVLNDTDKDSTESRFSLPLPGVEKKADAIFATLISAGRKRAGKEEDVVDITGSVLGRVRQIVGQYNSLHPVWSFVKTTDTTELADVKVPFIRVDGKSLNDININLKETKANCMQGIRTMDNDFTTGYIPYLVLSFIGGLLPKEINAIVFNKTIAVNGNTYFKGYRLRVLTENANADCLQRCKDYIEDNFIKEHSTPSCDYSKCVVRISCPK